LISDETRLAVLEERLRGMDRALELQAREYDRRLHELNHAHEQAVEVQHTYVTEEVHARDRQAAVNERKALYDAAAKRAESIALALTEAKETADQRFARIEAFQAKLLGAFALAILFIPLLSGILVYFVTHKFG